MKNATMSHINMQTHTEVSHAHRYENSIFPQQLIYSKRVRYRESGSTHCVYWIISSIQIILYATFFYLKWIPKLPFLRGFPRSDSSVYFPGCCKISKDVKRKNNIFLHNKAWHDFHFRFHKLLKNVLRTEGKFAAQSHWVSSFILSIN